MAERGSTRLAELFTPGRPVLLPYLTAGIPDPGSSPAMFRAMVAADGFEVGIPYADPLMDGPVIAGAGRAAIARGMTVEGAIGLIGQVARDTGKPVLAMTYTNPILRLGIDTFLGEIASAGAVGLIVADLPAEEAHPLLEAASRNGLGMALFVSPTTSDGRLAEVAAARPAFLYGVATMGVTGERDRFAATASDLAARVRAITDIPLVLGVGISTPEQAAAAGAVADGVIVGSALVRTVMEAGSPEAAAQALQSQVEALAEALKV